MASTPTSREGTPAGDPDPAPPPPAPPAEPPAEPPSVPGAPAPGLGAPAGQKTKTNDAFFGILVWVVVGLIFAGFYIAGYIRQMEELELVASAQPVGADKLAVSGIVVWNGDPITGARVWAIASSDAGNRVPISRSITNADGRFDLPEIGATINGQEVTSILVYATGTSKPAADPEKTGPKLQGREMIRLGKAATTGAVAGARTRRVAPPFSLVLLLLVSLMSFFASLAVASVRMRASRRYFLSLACAFVLMVSMSLVLVMGMAYVSTRGVAGDVFTFGFASVICGAPSEGVAREWMFSLTTPSTDSGRLTGFFAPLWVMLLSVIGAGLLTLSLLLTEIRNPPDFSRDDDDVRRRIQNIVMHQFFILFAPLGAIFVFQALLVAKAAEEPIAVAIAALGAGATLNALLKVAVDRTSRLFEAPGTEETRRERRGRAEQSAAAPPAAPEGEPAAVSLADTATVPAPSDR